VTWLTVRPVIPLYEPNVDFTWDFSHHLVAPPGSAAAAKAEQEGASLFESLNEQLSSKP